MWPIVPTFALGLLRTNSSLAMTHASTKLDCSDQDSNLDQRGSLPRASARWATRAPAFTPHSVTPDSPPHPLDPGGIRTLISWVQIRGPPSWTTDPVLSGTRCEKDSNLQPRPSEGRARPIELSQRLSLLIRSLPTPH